MKWELGFVILSYFAGRLGGGGREKGWGMGVHAPGLGLIRKTI